MPCQQKAARPKRQHTQDTFTDATTHISMRKLSLSVSVSVSLSLSLSISAAKRKNAAAVPLRGKHLQLHAAAALPSDAFGLCSLHARMHVQFVRLFTCLVCVRVCVSVCVRARSSALSHLLISMYAFSLSLSSDSSSSSSSPPPPLSLSLARARSRSLSISLSRYLGASTLASLRAEQAILTQKHHMDLRCDSIFLVINRPLFSQS